MNILMRATRLRRVALTLPPWLLALSFLALASAPLLMPADYDWIDHTTSESAAQTIGNAWLGRLGFLCWGVAALALALGRRPGHARVKSWALLVFGLSMLGAALFSTRSWRSDAAFDPMEDGLHSFFASFMGVAFIVAVASNLARLSSKRSPWLDAMALAAALIAPALMALRPELAGLAQRLMFLAAYIWFFREAALLVRNN